jgi:hypothetical protein
MTEKIESGGISDEQMRTRLLELGVPAEKLDWLIERISPDARPNFFVCEPETIDELLTRIEELPRYDF